jgi:hypothetical protein
VNTAYELPTPQRPGVVRRAYRLCPPFENHDGEHRYVVVSNNFREVLAFPGRLRRNVLGRPIVRVEEFRELSSLSGTHRIRGLLTQMGYPAVADLTGRVTVLGPNDEGPEDRL